MTTVRSQVVFDSWLEATVLEIKTCLEAKKKQVVEEIVAYPPPIPACDAQFNFLLEERARLSQALSRLEALTGESLPPADRLYLLDEFIQSSPDLDPLEKQKIRLKRDL